MKLLQITALALCLNIPMAHAGGEITNNYNLSPSQIAGAVAVTAASAYSVPKAVNLCSHVEPTSSRILICSGALIAIGGVAQLSYNALQCPAFLADGSLPFSDNASSAASTAIGLALLTTGIYLQKK